MSSEPTPKTSTNTLLTLVRCQLLKWNVYEQDLRLTLLCTRQHANRGSYLEWEDHMVAQTDTGCTHLFSRWHWRLYVFVKPSTGMAPPGNLCSQEYNKTWVLSFTQEYQPSLGKTCFPWNSSLVCHCLMTWQSDGFTWLAGSSPQSLRDCGHSKPVCLR